MSKVKDIKSLKQGKGGDAALASNSSLNLLHQQSMDRANSALSISDADVESMDAAAIKSRLLMCLKELSNRDTTVRALQRNYETPDFLLSFAEDNSIRIGKHRVLFYKNVSPDSCRDRPCCKRRYSTTAGAFDLERKRGAPSIHKSYISANHPLFDRRSTSCTDCWTLGCSPCF